MSELPVEVFLPERAPVLPVSVRGRARRFKRAAVKASRALVLGLTALVGTAAIAFAEDRSLKLHFTHTGERAVITYKRDGRFDQKGLAQVNRILRDWRRNQSTRMDPRLLDLVWEVYQRSGATDYIHIVSAYRSPATNNMLRGRSRKTGVAKKSQHMLGKAMDFYIPGVKLSTLRQLAMQMQVGGVGYYPTSGSPFVHLDVGNVRAWPRMSRQELARIFPNGKTMHLPANGKPLPGYAQAVADYKRRVGARSIEIASTAPDEDDNDRVSAKRPASGILTAMLPTPKSRAQAALAEQVSARVTPRLPDGTTAPEVIPQVAPRVVSQTIPQSTSQAVAAPAFVDLAALSVPAPGLRPQAAAAVDPIETASLAPAPVPVPPIPAPAPSFADPRSLALPRPALQLKAPSGSIGLLPITAAEDLDEEDALDADDSVIAWALAAPGSSAGMSAPLPVRRILTPADTTAAMAAPLPVAVSQEFDTDSFWSGG